MFDNLRADFSRNISIYYRYKGYWRKYFTIFFNFGCVALIVYRFGKWAMNIKIPLVGHFLLFLYYIPKFFVLLFFGTDIVLRTDIGKGFIIHNFQGIMINAKKIGENCTVNQGVMIGAVIESGPNPPVIGNNVYFGAGCIVLGDITIGNNVTIGANSLVINSVSDNCTVIGVPARVVSYHKEIKNI